MNPNVKLPVNTFRLERQVHMLDCAGSNTVQVQAAGKVLLIAFVTVYKATGLVPSVSHIT